LDTLKRHGVVIEQCPACQGVFLDRGELEQLIDAETEHLAENGYQGRHRGGIVQQIFEAG
jgi:Zn-finger nucleic acid-binding protein